MNPVNNNANPNSSTDSRAYFCPACGSANVNASSLAGGSANCNICTWKGTVEELPTFVFQHDLGGPEEVFRTFFLDIRKLLGQHFATQIGHLLIKWGFLDAPTPENQQRVIKTLSRYVAAITKAAVVAIVEERKAMEKEKFREQSSG